MHADQLTVSPDTVSDLVRSQFPQWGDLPIRQLASAGTVNAIFRIGERLTARFPLQPQDVERARRWLESEADAARELLGRTRFPTPEPLGLGEPGFGYPMPWSVQTWVPGVVATEADPSESEAFAYHLVEFIRDVRTIDVRGRTFGGSGRGGTIADHEEWIETCLRESEQLLDVPRLRRLWARWRDLPRGDDPDVMSHGDLIPGNVLVADGRLAGVLDVGGLGPADPALELVGAWHLLEAGPRRILRRELGCDDLEWERGKAWAFEQAMGAGWYYQYTNPAMSSMAVRTLARLVEDSPMS
ncbi:aminoglycoside phosphotransferase family protein [Actinopolymorpha singaporensis]|uniref:Predicted kinase, aminoglycoside phosphotransferase (APT) family n=1 Tax=Actinopolymorpha singaporensis TaxID=117157 RepID=A0A1H1P1M0_9ACTN|nr:aminoglycoside phosphotransferase family protein [Actinopolymorpha singaporensis]SDS05083.1 Predicted kinase, aminoglycoside phosphotransferase (APT) family [Actinopolymorpha singaporensis]